MEEVAGWVAPAATMIAAMMTAANLGARFTGWGFVVFLVGSIGWSIVGMATGQQNLVLTNGFLSIVNIVGIWRWLGRQARLEEGATKAVETSQVQPAPTLFPLTNLGTAPVEDEAGETIGHCAGAMAECGTGRVSYVVVREGGAAGINERYRAVPWRMVRVEQDVVRLVGERAGYDALPEITPTQWPAQSPR
jgi:hypothetical protein